jgi:hypothetical protein
MSRPCVIKFNPVAAGPWVQQTSGWCETHKMPLPTGEHIRCPVGKIEEAEDGALARIEMEVGRCVVEAEKKLRR